ncbi:hypothetical protein PFISCL1PPCAC_16278, partial [Pristionchus fissidentatus]
ILFPSSSALLEVCELCMLPLAITGSCFIKIDNGLIRSIMLLRLLFLAALAVLCSISLAQEDADYEVRLPEKRFRGWSEVNSGLFLPRSAGRVVGMEKNNQEKRQMRWNRRYLDCLYSMRDSQLCQEKI